MYVKVLAGVMAHREMLCFSRLWANQLVSDTRLFTSAIFKHSIILEKSFLITVGSVPCAQQSLIYVYIETL